MLTPVNKYYMNERRQILLVLSIFDKDYLCIKIYKSFGLLESEIVITNTLEGWILIDKHRAITYIMEVIDDVQ